MNMPIPTDDYASTACGIPTQATQEPPSRWTQVGGDHYQRLSPQPWDVFENWFGHEGFVGFLLGTIIKYLIRYKHKGGVEDLKKAQHVLLKLIETESTGGPTGLGPLGWKQTYNK